MPAFLLNPLIRYALIGVVIAALFGWAMWERNDAIAAAKGEAAARVELASAVERATQNYAAAQSCFAQVEQDKQTIAIQSDAAEKMRANFNDMERAAVNLETEKAQLLQTLDERTQATEAEAKARPADVRGLGPIAKARAAQLWN